MRKRFLTSLLVTGLVMGCLTGCQKEADKQEQPQQEQPQQEQNLQEETGDDVADTQETGYVFTCSLCETEKICGIYTAEGTDYVVCHDCSEEFTTAHAEVADKAVCSSCQEEKICGTYTVDGTEYVVCPDDFDEFSNGMGLGED